MNKREIAKVERQNKKSDLSKRFVHISDYDINLIGRADTKFIAEEKDTISDSLEVLTAKYGNLQLIGYCGYFIEQSIDKGRPKISKRTAVLGLCDCGRYTIGRLKDVKAGKKNSCGCKSNGLITVIKQIDLNKEKENLKNLFIDIKEKRKELALSPERIKFHKQSIIKDKYQKYITDSKKRRKGNGIEFDLTFEQFEEKILKNCHYCGQSSKESPTYNGLDRINNDIHYTYNNVVPCCPDCNRMKFTKTTDEFYAKIARIQNLKGNQV